MLPSKQRISRGFARAAATYDRQAVIQRRVADTLLSLLDMHHVALPGRLLEIGCCTGILSVRLAARYPGSTFHINDLVAAFRPIVLSKLSTETMFLAGDIEQVVLPDKLDLVISSSTFHWLADLPALLGRLQAVMVPGAVLCFSMYGPANFCELRKVTGTGLDYSTLAEIRNTVGEYFSIIACQEETITLRFPDTPAMLLHLRETGVNALAPRLGTSSRMTDFREQYERLFRGPDGVALTYNPIYCLARKP